MDTDSGGSLFTQLYPPNCIPSAEPSLAPQTSDATQKVQEDGLSAWWTTPSHVSRAVRIVSGAPPTPSASANPPGAAPGLHVPPGHRLQWGLAPPPALWGRPTDPAGLGKLFKSCRPEVLQGPPDTSERNAAPRDPDRRGPTQGSAPRAPGPSSRLYGAPPPHRHPSAWQPALALGLLCRS